MNVRLTVVVPSVNGKRFILECLEKLEQQSERKSIEVIVCDRLRDDTAETIRRRFPWVRLESGLYEYSIPALRWHGIKRARADIVAVIEDHCLASLNWARDVLAAHDRGCDVGGGPVENASCETLFDWAFFLMEYAAFMPPVAEGLTSFVPGINVAYKKSILPLEDDRFAELWESFLLDHLRRRGARMCLRPGMQLRHRTPFTFGEFLGQRYLYSRSFAAMRVRESSRAQRFLYGIGAALVLPFLLPLRLVRTVWGKKRNRRELAMSLPMLLLFFVCALAGEVAGYWFGDGGSLQRVK